MNLLQLVNAARVECGVSGPALTATSGTSGEAARFVAWVQQAWWDLQSLKEDWEWMRKAFTLTLTPSKASYTVAETSLTDFGNWRRDSFRCSTDNTYVDEQLLNFMDWPTFRNLYRYANMRSTYSRPVVVAIGPDKSLNFGPGPSLNYLINGEYYSAPAALATDASSPTIPDRFHMMLVYRTMMYYGGYEAAPEVLSRGDQEYRRLMSRLEIDQLPTITSGPPLA